MCLQVSAGELPHRDSSIARRCLSSLALMPQEDPSSSGTGFDMGFAIKKKFGHSLARAGISLVPDSRLG